jgi:hypothetical protein
MLSVARERIDGGSIEAAAVWRWRGEDGAQILTCAFTVGIRCRVHQ